MNKKNFRLPRYSRNKYAGRIADAYSAPVSLFTMMNNSSKIQNGMVTGVYPHHCCGTRGGAHTSLRQ